MARAGSRSLIVFAPACSTSARSSSSPAANRRGRRRGEAGTTAAATRATAPPTTASSQRSSPAAVLDTRVATIDACAPAWVTSIGPAFSSTARDMAIAMTRAISSCRFQRAGRRRHRPRRRGPPRPPPPPLAAAGRRTRHRGPPRRRPARRTAARVPAGPRRSTRTSRQPRRTARSASRGFSTGATVDVRSAVPGPPRDVAAQPPAHLGSAIMAPAIARRATWTAIPSSFRPRGCTASGNVTGLMPVAHIAARCPSPPALPTGRRAARTRRRLHLRLLHEVPLNRLPSASGDDGRSGKGVSRRAGANDRQSCSAHYRGVCRGPGTPAIFWFRPWADGGLCR